MAEPTTFASEPIHFGSFQVNLHTRELRKNGSKIKLEGQPFQVLALLLERPGKLVTREELEQKLWAPGTFVDFEHSINAAVKRLREILGDSADSPHFIETLPRRGYRFIYPVDGGPIAAEVPRLAAWWRARWVLGSLGIVAVLGILLAANFGRLRGRLLPALVEPRIKSLAVLPLENLTGDPAQEYFVDGMTNALIAELAKVRGLKVISRTSVMHYKGARKTLPEIARELQVDAVVEGTVERNGNEVKITAQLIRAATDTHVWAASYARTHQDVLRLQADVAEEITRQISNRLSPVERTGTSKPSVVDPEAYEAYLKGLYFSNRLIPNDLRTGLHYYQAAIGKDPNYAAAYAGLARTYMALSALGEMSGSEANARARQAAEKAVALDENLVEAHDALGAIAQLYDWDWNKAQREYRRAIDLNPNYASAHLGYSSLLLTLGKPKESAEEVRKAKELDPLSLSTYSSGVLHLYATRQYNEALLEARRGLELYPDAPLLHDFLSGIYAQTEQPRLAAEEALKAEESWGASQERMAALRRANEASGAEGLWWKRVELNKKVAGQQYLNAFDIANDYALLGDRSETLDWLERAYRVRDARFPYVKFIPLFDSVRSDPRFQDLMRRMNFPQQAPPS